MMFSSSVGSLSEISSLFPFHHLKINNKLLRTSHHNFLSIGLSHQQQSLQFHTTKKKSHNNGFFIFCSSSTDDFTTSDTSSMEESSSTTTTTTTTTTTEEEEEEPEATTTNPAPVKRSKTRYRKEYPGESKGIVEEMRFVAMRLHNKKKKIRIRRKRKEEVEEESSNDEQETLEKEEEEEEDTSSDKDSDSDDGGDGETLEAKEEGEALESSDKDAGGGGGGEAETWQPSIEGFLKYLVDSKLVFETLERIVNESDNNSYTYFRNTGLERSAGLAKDLEWFHQQNNVIPEPSKHGVNYARYLEELAAKNVPMFLCHYYNIYFAHVSGGQVTAKQVSEKILEGKELEFNTWEGDAFELLKNVRDNLNNLGEDWTRDEKNKCLKESTKSFRYLGNIVRLIVL